jgi:hypothetical protein
MFEIFNNMYMYIYYLVMSDEWINTFDAVFFLTIGSLVFGCFGLVIRYCLKSKCDNINLCFGLITVHRNVELEAEEEMKQMELGIKDDESKE